jgi:hypothetical protein
MPNYTTPTLKEACAAALAWSQSPNFTAKEAPEPPFEVVDYFLERDHNMRLYAIARLVFAGTLGDRAIDTSVSRGQERGHRGHADPKTADLCLLLDLCTQAGVECLEAKKAVFDYECGRLNWHVRAHWHYIHFRRTLGLLLREGAIQVFFCPKCLKDECLDDTPRSIIQVPFRRK